MNFTEEHRKQLLELERLREQSLREALKPYVERLAQTKSEDKIYHILLGNVDRIFNTIKAHE